MLIARHFASYSLLRINNLIDLLGGAKGNRTPDLLNAIQTLSQLSYGPFIQKGYTQ